MKFTGLIAGITVLSFRLKNGDFQDALLWVVLLLQC